MRFRSVAVLESCYYEKVVDSRDSCTFMARFVSVFGAVKSLKLALWVRQ